MIIAAVLLHRPTRESIVGWSIAAYRKVLTISLRQERKELLRDWAHKN